MPGDFADVKLRVPESPVFIRTLAAPGAQPSPAPGRAMHTALQTGLPEVQQEAILTGAERVERENRWFTQTEKLVMAINEVASPSRTCLAWCRTALPKMPARPTFWRRAAPFSNLNPASRGGPGQVNIATSLLFSGISGSAAADIAAVVGMLVPAMERAGHKPEWSADITTSSAIIGPIIPPSIRMVAYGAMTGLSIGDLFLAGSCPVG